MNESAALEKLLLDLFSVDELRAFVSHRVSGGEELLRHVPGRDVPPATFAGELVAQLRRRGLIDPEFFTAVVAERPRRAEEIVAVKRLFQGAPSRRPASPHSPPRPPSGDGSPVDADEAKYAFLFALYDLCGPSARSASLSEIADQAQIDSYDPELVVEELAEERLIRADLPNAYRLTAQGVRRCRDLDLSDGAMQLLELFVGRKGMPPAAIVATGGRGRAGPELVACGLATDMGSGNYRSTRLSRPVHAVLRRRRSSASR